MATASTPADVIRRAASLRETLHASFRDEAVRSIYAEATRIANRAAHAGLVGARATSISASIAS